MFFISLIGGGTVIDVNIQDSVRHYDFHCSPLSRSSAASYYRFLFFFYLLPLYISNLLCIHCTLLLEFNLHSLHIIIFLLCFSILNTFATSSYFISILLTFLFLFFHIYNSHSFLHILIFLFTSVLLLFFILLLLLTLFVFLWWTLDG